MTQWTMKLKNIDKKYLLISQNMERETEEMKKIHR